MTKTPYSACIIAPQAEWDAIRKFLASQGYDLGEGRPMSADGKEPAMHRGAHMWLTEEQAQVFTLRQKPKKAFKDKYTLAEAQTCLEKYKARADGISINHGSTSDALRTSHISINTDGVRPTKRAHFDTVAGDVGVKLIEIDAQAELDGANENKLQKNNRL
jgi:hypothetical protein